MFIGSRQRLQSVKDNIHNVTVTINGTIKVILNK